MLHGRFSPMRWLVMPLLFVLTACPTAHSRSASHGKTPTRYPKPESASIIEWVSDVLVSGNMSVNVSNYGLLGNETNASERDYQLPDPNRPGMGPISGSAEFPAGSGVMHLYGGSIWIGGIRGHDTLVTSTMDGSSRVIPEFTPETPLTIRSRLPYSGFFDPSARADLELDCTMSDTAFYQIPDDEGAIFQHPLGLLVRQTARAWLCEPYDDFVFLTYRVQNRDTVPFESMYVAIFLDADVHSKDDLYGILDDVAGYLKDQSLAYVIDNDGDPIGGQWTSASARGAIGVTPIAISPAPACTTFKWWNMGGSAFLHNTFLDPPVGDRAEYRRMTETPSMVDQMRAAVEYGFPIPPRSVYDDVADGLDTRILQSFGPYDLAPGDSVTITLALVMGDSVHAAPEDFTTYWDPYQPETYYSHLKFDDLIRNTETARAFYAGGFDPVGAAPIALHAEPSTDTSIALDWQPVRFWGVNGYRVYRRPVGAAEWTLIGEVSGDKHCFVDHAVIPTNAYEYSVAAIDESGEGYKSRPVAITAARPLIVPTLLVLEESPAVKFSWSIALPEPQFSPPCYLNIYRRQDSDSNFTILDYVPIIGVAPAPTRPQPQGELAARAVPHSEPWIPTRNMMADYTDETVESGVVYWYAASITNTLGLEGPWSDSARAVPMRLSGGVSVLRIVNAYEKIRPSSPNPASVFYEAWALNAGYEYRNSDPSISASTQDTLRRVTSQSQVLVVADEFYDWLPFSLELQSLIEDFMRAGGSCLFVGRGLPSRFAPVTRVIPAGPESPYGEYQRFDSTTWVWRVLGVYGEHREVLQHSESLTPPSVVPVDLAYAEPEQPPWPRLWPDSALAFSVFPIDEILKRYPPSGGGRLPFMAGIDSIVTGEILYRFVSVRPDTSHYHNKILGFARDAPGAHFVLINVPLSLIEHDSAVAALDAAMAWLDDHPVATSEGESGSALRQLLDYLYRRCDVLNPAWDQDGDGEVGLLDLVRIIDRVAAQP